MRDSLSELKCDDASLLPSRFNADNGLARLVLLVSPTCNLCVAGAQKTAEALLPIQAAFQLYVVWLPVLADDTPEAAEVASSIFAQDPRVAQFWDQGLVVSSSYHRVLELGRRAHRVAWDLYLLYQPEVLWAQEPPAPSFWMHQLFFQDVPQLDPALLAQQLLAYAQKRPASVRERER